MLSRLPAMRPAYLVILALVVAPAWKGVEWAYSNPGPKSVSPEAAVAGGKLFHHVWTEGDVLASSDGLGPVFNARSCVECHLQGGPGGGGPIDKNVMVYGLPTQPSTAILPAAGVVHRHATKPEYQETLHNVNPALPGSPVMELSTILSGGGTQVGGVVISQRNTPALFGDGLIDAVLDDAIISHEREHSLPASLVGLNGAKDGRVRGRVARLVDGRVGKFGWKGEFATLTDFVKAACANELGLSNPGRPQPSPLGRPGLVAQGVDLTDAQCELMTDFLRDLPKPIEARPTDSATRARFDLGRAKFVAIGCADCHTPKLGSVDGLYSDLLLHDMGVNLESSPGAYGQPPVPAPQFAADSRPNSAEWRTPPLWGVADSGPYLHDGRAATLEAAIELHGGESVGVAAAFKDLPGDEREAILVFLGGLRAPPRDEARGIALR